MLPGAKSQAWGSTVVYEDTLSPAISLMPGFPSGGHNLVLELDWVFFKTPGFFSDQKVVPTWTSDTRVHTMSNCLWHVDICFSACWPSPSQFPITVLIFIILEWKHQHESNIALSNKIRKGHQVTWSVLDGHVGVCPPWPDTSFPFVFWICKGKGF